MQISKTWLAMFLAAVLFFSPALNSLAAAGSFNYDGISSVVVNDDYDIPKHRGLMLNFSFGGPKNHKQINSLKEDVLKRDEKINKVGGYVILAMAVGIFIAIEVSDD